ncbi:MULTISPECIES: sensor histidine kinase [Streptosporangium]|uniref:histidine kinase n=1 Tax=Streptosporangium brasiliense TaxID=47480 RepID=A0ABT9QV90_9ACTN|nr:nitrate- and nitrite sensing domain-containing protein [Streptosporangium brasiliense]MDP9860919.1 signal transduction histidine kinase [Streptosporangium brasiliense]
MRTASIPSERESGAESPPAFDAEGVPPEGGPAPDLGDRGTEKNGSKLALKNWRVRTRLIALIVIPTAAAIVLGGLRVVTSISTAAQYEQVRTSAELVADLSDLAHNLETERDLSARFVAQGRGSTGRARLQEQYKAVDQVAKSVKDRIDIITGSDAAEGFGERGRSELAQMRSRIEELGSVRKTAVGTQLPAQPTIAMYSRTISDLLALHDEIIQGVADQELTGSASAFGALARAKEQASRERANLAVALAARGFTSEGLNAMLAARAQRDSELATFRSDASIAQRQLYDDTVSSQKKDRAESMRARALVLAVDGSPLVRVDVSRTGAGDQTTWFDASSDGIDRMRRVEKQIADTLIAQSRVLQEDEQRGALIAGGLSVLLLILVLIITSIMARSLVKPLRTLRTEALFIAGERLPETVQSMRESGEAAAEDVIPIGVASDDEIGQVARAFDEVHREAVRLAGQEATLRSNVNAMFVNLSRRTQTLVERQLSLIENLEQGEQDENRLGSLFRLDHLATRMRRNSENLLVLAGQEPARRWSQPVPLIDVVRASLSEVENYERVDLRISGGVSVVGTSVNDVVHLIAELVENAISFSPRETKVVVSSNRIDGGGVMVSVTDIGIGMTPEELGRANWRLANPPVVDVSVSRRMGLFVVGRLALRHGIRVQLRQQDSGGLTAMVLLPEALLSGSGARQVPGGDWAGAGAMGSMDRAPALASPTGLDPAQPTFASFDAAQHSFNSFDIGQLGSFEAPQPSPGGGYFGQAPVDTPWPGHVPPPGADSGWPNTPQADTGVWSNPPARDGDSGMWSNPPSREGDSAAWPGPPSREGDSGMWSNASMRGGDSGVWPDPPSREGDSVGWPSTADPGPFERRSFEVADNTGPLPVVRDSSPMEEAKEEFLPIFAAVESDWFKKVEPAAPVQDLTEELKEADAPAPASDAWSSPADVGWQAAQAASEPSLGGITGSGLPKRVPKANLVPGTAAPDAGAASQTPVLRPTVSPEAVRNRLASFQKGVRQGRAAARGEAGDGQPYPDFGRDVEGNKEDR